MRELVEFLCSPACLPRNPGTDGGLAARAYLRDRLEELGLEPAGDQGFDQPIPNVGAANFLVRIPGRGDRYVLIGAHYDACLDDNPGADDNAAAVAITLEVAARLREQDLDRSVIIALFDAEEPPYFLGPTMGSQWFVDHPTIPLQDLDRLNYEKMAALANHLTDLVVTMANRPCRDRSQRPRHRGTRRPCRRRRSRRRLRSGQACQA